MSPWGRTQFAAASANAEAESRPCFTICDRSANANFDRWVSAPLQTGYRPGIFRIMAVRIVDDSHGVRMAVKVVPGASRDRIVGKLGDALKVAVSKPPEAGAANKAVIALLARSLDIPQHRIEIVRGQTQPRKDVLIRGMSIAQIQSRLNLSP